MEMDSILGFLDNKTILITGATGFLAKIFVEKILRVQPNVNKLYLLVRATDAKSALQRFNKEAVAKDLFNILKEKYGTNLQSFLSEKVTPVAGDITYENLGIKDPGLIKEMWGDIDVVVNVAATTNFDERYDVALALNTFGAKNVLNFAAKCKIKLLLHVSTAYVSGEKPGLILETPYHLGEALNGAHGLDINTEKRIIEERLKELSYDETATDKSITLAMKDLGIERANKFGWPNTYVFTKALGEMMLGHLKGNMPLVILRPTIITSTYKEPFPGWIGGIRTIDSLALGYGKGQLSCFLGDPESVIDTIPADMVANAMIATMAAHANQASCEIIYHVGSSVSNPLKYKSIQQSGYNYFSKHPMINKEGKAVIVSNVKVLNSMASFQRYFSLRYLIPLQGLQAVNATLCHALNGTYTNLKRKTNFVLRLVELYKPYLFSKCLYDDMNTEKLRQLVRENEIEADMFYFDPKTIKWDVYFEHTHLPGVVKHVFK
ncbi:fatty acyl-CoA reductase 3-like [Bidens hawaiensis]|uniref:fatty acyl-CoA reductase 3-like n=1 Tax=Bidens hawaiensis TaxID=980011 RepID=UPI0040497C12